MSQEFSDALREQVANAIRPRLKLSVSAWADRYRRLSGKASSEKGVWRTSRTPYLKDPMDDLSLSSTVQRVVLMFPTQSGKTEVAFNWIGYIMDHAQAPALAVVPTLELRKRWVSQRLNPLISESPRLAAIFDAKKRRDGGNSEDIKDFPGGMLIIGGANSPSSLSSMPVKYVVLDEVARFPWDVGGEGDPVGLIDERQKTFPRRKTLLISTPTTKDECRIEQEFLAGDQRYYQVPCPHCGEYQRLEWNDKRIRRHISGTVTYTCVHCEDAIHEHHKTEMLAKGIWVPENSGSKVRSYHLNALYAPLGLGFTWEELWDKWKEAQTDTIKLKRFTNTALALTYEEDGKQADSNLLLLRREEYGDLDIRPLAMTFGADVQGNRIELTLNWWGLGEECWVADHLIISGDTQQDAVWDELGELLNDLSPDAGCIDASYRPDRVKAFCSDRAWCIPINGRDGAGRPLVQDRKDVNKRLRKRRKDKVYNEILGVDSGKSILLSRLQQESPGGGYIHFPLSSAFDDEYFEQLTAEKLVTEIVKGKKKSYWKKTRTRNEALDCWIYALAALRISVNLEQRNEKRQAVLVKFSVEKITGFSEVKPQW